MLDVAIVVVVVMVDVVELLLVRLLVELPIAADGGDKVAEVPNIEPILLEGDEMPFVEDVVE